MLSLCKPRMFLAAFCLLAANLAHATAQIPERIKVDEGEAQPLFSEPLRPFLLSDDAHIKALGRHANTGCSASWRGYQGHWTISSDQQLMLTALFANPCSDKPAPIPLTTFFPDATGPVPAKWFSGKLLVPLGKMVQYQHMGYESEYEKYLIITVDQGKVTSRETSTKRP